MPGWPGRRPGRAAPWLAHIDKEGLMLKRPRHQVVTEALGAYVGWRDACLRVEYAYAAWRSRDGRRSAATFLAYTAALDHEEQAAQAYAACIRPIAATHSFTARAA